jgi:hypothetical protein
MGYNSASKGLNSSLTSTVCYLRATVARDTQYDMAAILFVPTRRTQPSGPVLLSVRPSPGQSCTVQRRSAIIGASWHVVYGRGATRGGRCVVMYRKSPEGSARQPVGRWRGGGGGGGCSHDSDWQSKLADNLGKSFKVFCEIGPGRRPQCRTDRKS